MSVVDRLARLKQTIQEACEKPGRNPDSIQIVAVTKYVSLERAKEAIAAGVTNIGENRAEGMNEKWEEIQDDGIWHFIGSLQTRKVRDVVNKIDYLHSLDRPSLAKEVDKRLEDGNVLKCFVQVNVSGEESKAGLDPTEVVSFIEEIARYKKIRVVGLMTMAPFYEDPEQTRPIFQKLRMLRDEVVSLNLPHAPCTELSMGMSNDFSVAVEEGATFVRIGTALVGKE